MKTRTRAARRIVPAAAGALLIALAGGMASARAAAAGNPAPADTAQQAAERAEINDQLPVQRVNDIRASCAEGTRKAPPSADDLPLGEGCLTALVRSVRDGYARDYYTWEYAAIAQLAGATQHTPTNAEADGLARQLDRAAKNDEETTSVGVGGKIVDFPVLRSRAFDAAYVTAMTGPMPAKASLSDAKLRQITQSCYANQDDVTRPQCRDAAREFARRARLRAQHR
jgi:hypothetical protein